LFLTSGQMIAVAISRRGLSLEAMRTMQTVLQGVIRTANQVLGDDIERIELLGDLRLTFAKGDSGWWAHLHAEQSLDDMAVRRLDGTLRAAGASLVA
jgi:hypothetical protein